MKEQWRKMAGWPEYSISTFGRVRRDIAGKHVRVKLIGKPTYGRIHNGYADIGLQGNGRKSVRRRVHHLVLETFIGSRPKGQECRHLDDVRNNNRLTNLRWGTHKENYYYMKRNGRGRKYWGKTFEESSTNYKKIAATMRKNGTTPGYGHLSKFKRKSISMKMVATKALRKSLGYYE